MSASFLPDLWSTYYERFPRGSQRRADGQGLGSTHAVRSRQAITKMFDEMFDAIYCENGHFIASLPENPHYTGRIGILMDEHLHKELERLSYCTKCGKSTLGFCLGCDATIRVEKDRPSYCGKCGKPYPWTQATLQAANEYTDELEGVSDEDKTELKATFPKLTVDTPETPLAESRFKKYLLKIGSPAASGLTRILGEVLTAEIKRHLGLGIEPSQGRLGFAYCSGVSLRYTLPLPCSIACSSICRASDVPQASPFRASSLIFSGSVNLNLRGRGVFRSASKN